MPARTEELASLLVIGDPPADLGPVFVDLPLDVVRVATPDEAARRLAAEDFAAALLHVPARGPGPGEMLRRLRAGDRPLPILVLSDTALPAAAQAEAYRLGALDCLAGPQAADVLRAK